MLTHRIRKAQEAILKHLRDNLVRVSLITFELLVLHYAQVNGTCWLMGHALLYLQVLMKLYHLLVYVGSLGESLLNFFKLPG